MTGDLKEKGLALIKERLEENGLQFSISEDILANQFLETGNYGPEEMRVFLEFAYGIDDKALATMICNDLQGLLALKAGE